MKNTKNPVKFWFLKNFLSPTMTVMINDFTSDPVNIAWSLTVWNLIISEELKKWCLWSSFVFLDQRKRTTKAVLKVLYMYVDKSILSCAFSLRPNCSLKTGSHLCCTYFLGVSTSHGRRIWLWVWTCSISLASLASRTNGEAEGHLGVSTTLFSMLEKSSPCPFYSYQNILCIFLVTSWLNYFFKFF